MISNNVFTLYRALIIYILSPSHIIIRLSYAHRVIWKQEHVQIRRSNFDNSKGLSFIKLKGKTLLIS